MFIFSLHASYVPLSASLHFLLPLLPIFFSFLSPPLVLLHREEGGREERGWGRGRRKEERENWAGKRERKGGEAGRGMRGKEGEKEKVNERKGKGKRGKKE